MAVTVMPQPARPFVPKFHLLADVWAGAAVPNSVRVWILEGEETNTPLEACQEQATRGIWATSRGLA